MPALNPIGLFHDRVDAIRKFHENCRQPRAELDISGGIDSAVMVCLLAEALGPENITLVHSRFSTNSAQTQRARDLAKALGIPMLDFDGTVVFKALLYAMRRAVIEAHTPRCPNWASQTLNPGEKKWEEVEERFTADPTILGSLRSTLRAPIGRGFNRLLGDGIRHGTGNECEDRFLRFYQKGGDGEVDTNPMAMLTKTEVYQLAWACGEAMGQDVKVALRPIIEALPSPDLWGTGDEHSDEQELFDWLGVPFTYGRVDPDTGKILRFGTIERVARFLDGIHKLPDGSLTTGEKLIFSDLDPVDGWPFVATVARWSGYFDNFTLSETEAFLQAARKVERLTRHKMNPNIKTLGTREILVANGLVSDALTMKEG